MHPFYITAETKDLIPGRHRIKIQEGKKHDARYNNGFQTTATCILTFGSREHWKFVDLLARVGASRNAEGKVEGE